MTFVWGVHMCITARARGLSMSESDLFMGEHSTRNGPKATRRCTGILMWLSNQIKCTNH